MDPLSDILSLMKPSSYGFRGLDVGGDWALGYTASAGVRCYAIQSGQCRIEVEGLGAPLDLSAGDFVLLPGGTAYRLFGGAPTETIDAFQFFPTVPPGQTAILNGGGDCMGVGGYFYFAGLHAERLLEALPPILHIDAERSRATLSSSIDRLMTELRAPRPGSALMAEHLAQALLIEALRVHLEQAAGTGWLRALADPRINAAIAGMHSDPARRWTLHDLALVTNMSRSSFAARFKQKVGEPPMDYLTRWRMILAADRLANQGMTIAAVAPMVGYESESAFGAAFRRVIGYSPRRFAVSMGRTSPKVLAKSRA